MTKRGQQAASRRDDEKRRRLGRRRHGDSSVVNQLGLSPFSHAADGEYENGAEQHEKAEG